MAHYAFLDENNKVVKVITGKDEGDTDTLPEGFASWEEWYADFEGKPCKRTSYNTRGNSHKLGGTPFRGNYAFKGGVYDETNDVFYSPDPSDDVTSYTLNTSTWMWEEDTE